MFKKWCCNVIPASEPESLLYFKVLLFAVTSLLISCSGDKTAGTDEQSEGIVAIKNLDIAGVSQKGPFVKGSAVTVQGMDCKTMKLTGESFEGTVKNDKGEFTVDNVTLSSSCAVFEVTGNYFNEVTDKKTKDKLTLRALTNLKDRKNVNINVLTELEYERLMNLAASKETSFAEAKTQAEKEVLAAFGFNDSTTDKVQEFENLNIFEKGEGNAALLAVSVLMQGDADAASLAKRLEKFADDFAEDGEWNDSKTKTEIVEWATTTMENGKLDTIRKNVETMNDGDKVAAFETYVAAVIPDSVPGSASSSSKKISSSSRVDLILSSGDSRTSSSLQNDRISSSMKNASSSSLKIASSSSSTEGRGSTSSTKDSYLNPNIDYGEMTDPRDGQIYKTVKIGNQVWMAQNLNYADSVKTPSLKDKSWCYNDDPEKCAIAGRLYTWAAAIDSVKLATDKDNPVDCGNGKLCGLIGPLQGVCPDGWHLPSEKEWSEMDKAVAGNAVQDTSGKFFKTTKGWSGDNNGTDVAGFSAMPVGFRYGGFGSWGTAAYFWTSTEDNGNLTDWDYNPAIAHNRSFSTKDYYNISALYKYIGMSVRCVKGETAPVFLEKEESPKATYLNPKIKYDSIVDSRDGKVYKTVKIGNQTWMAQNLSYKMSGRFCYRDSVKYCNSYGGLYLWSAAIGQFETECDSKESCKIQGICPNGWHVPDTTEWSKLYSAVGRTPNAMQAKGFDYWPDATDDYGFSVIPAGNWFHDGFYNLGFTGDFWMSTRKDGGEPYYWDLDSEVAGFKTLISTQLRCSIRCIKDDDGAVPASSSSSKNVILSGDSHEGSSSSSVTLATSCKTETKDNCEYGTLTDSRDGQTYKTVKIGDQVWMAENLNYENGNSMCYSDDTTKCSKSGRIYTWDAAKEVCPSGWHLPDSLEWEALFSAVGTRGMAGRNLKSTIGWADNGNGVDAYGFSVLPIAFWDDPDFIARDEYAKFWSSTEVGADKAELQDFYMSYDSVLHGSFSKKMAVSVRCIKD